MKNLEQNDIRVGVVVSTARELAMFRSDGHPIPAGSVGTIISVKRDGSEINRFSIEWRLSETYIAITLHDQVFNRTIERITSKSPVTEEFYTLGS